jgi:hypothetical protein
MGLRESVSHAAKIGQVANATGLSIDWDKEWLISHSMGEHDRRIIVWDYNTVYPRGAVWDATPPEPLYSGGPVVRAIDEARSALSGALNGAQAQGAGAK